MLLRILLLLAVIVAILYVALPTRRIEQIANHVGRRGNRLMMTLLTLSAMVFLALAALCAIVWLGSVNGGITGGGDVLSSTTLLRLAGLFLLLALACATMVVYGRK